MESKIWNQNQAEIQGSVKKRIVEMVFGNHAHIPNHENQTAPPVSAGLTLIV